MKKNNKRILQVLLSVLALTMLLCVPVSAASKKTVATIGKTSYTSLDAAVKKVKNGQTIKLKSDTTVKSALSRDKTYTINLNGHTLKGKKSIGNLNSQAVKISKGNVTLNNGTVTGLLIAKGVTVTSSKTEFSDSTQIKKGGKLKIKSGNIDKCIFNYGTLTINKVTMDMSGIGIWNESTGKATLKGGTYNGSIENEGKMTISGGTYKYKYNGPVLVNSMDTASLTITGGSFKSAYNYAVWNQSGVMKISGGTFKSTGSNDQNSVYGTIYCGWQSNTEITGGTISSKYSNGIYVASTASSFKQSGAKITVSSSKMKKIRDDR